MERRWTRNPQRVLVARSQLRNGPVNAVKTVLARRRRKSGHTLAQRPQQHAADGMVLGLDLVAGGGAQRIDMRADQVRVLKRDGAGLVHLDQLAERASHLRHQRITISAAETLEVVRAEVQRLERLAVPVQ